MKLPHGKGEDVPASLKDRPLSRRHGDTFDLPAGTVHLAPIAPRQNQAFSFEKHPLARQFHPEIAASRFEHWLIGHANEIASVSNISPPLLRAATNKNAPTLESVASACLTRWLAQLP